MDPSQHEAESRAPLLSKLQSISRTVSYQVIMFLPSLRITRALTKSFERRETSRVSVMFRSELILAVVG